MKLRRPFRLGLLRPSRGRVRYSLPGGRRGFIVAFPFTPKARGHGLAKEHIADSVADSIKPFG